MRILQAFLFGSLLSAGCNTSNQIAPLKSGCCDQASLASSQHEDLEIPSATPWNDVESRSPLPILHAARYTDQDGARGTISELLDRPTALTFFYSRCQNIHKCSAAITALARLQAILDRAGISEEVRLIAATYEPQWDSSTKLRQYGVDRGLYFGSNAKAIAIDSAVHMEVIDELQVPVSYNAGWVNGHAVQLFLLDRYGRLVRSYHTIMWNPNRVSDDLRRLLDEEVVQRVDRTLR